MAVNTNWIRLIATLILKCQGCTDGLETGESTVP